MTARSHTDRGQLFGWDGANMWVEQTLGTVPALVTCERCDRRIGAYGEGAGIARWDGPTHDHTVTVTE